MAVKKRSRWGLAQASSVETEVKGYDQDRSQDVEVITDFVAPTQITSHPTQGTCPIMQGTSPLTQGTRFSSLMQSSSHIQGMSSPTQSCSPFTSYLMQSSPPMQGTQGTSSPMQSCSPLTSPLKQGTHLSSHTQSSPLTHGIQGSSSIMQSCSPSNQGSRTLMQICCPLHHSSPTQNISNSPMPRAIPSTQGTSHPCTHSATRSGTSLPHA